MRYLGFGFSVLAFIAATVAAAPARASHTASVVANAFDVESGHGNFDSQLGSTTASASYSNPEGGSASAFATISSTSGGGLTMKVFATGTAGEVVSNRGSANLNWDDTLQTTGTLLDLLIDFKFELTGTTSGNGRVSTSLVSCVGNNCNDPVGGETTGTFHVRANQPIPRSTPFTISIILSATAGGIASVGPATSTADFSHSLTLESITLTDANGNLVPGASLISESGFDYNPSIVPEPDSIGLLGVALAALAIRRRTSRRA